MSGARVAELANIALADIGEPPVIFASPLDPERAAWSSLEVDNRQAKRAIELAHMAVNGPSFQVYCAEHTRFSANHLCAMLPVADALRGHLCMNAPQEDAQ